MAKTYENEDGQPRYGQRLSGEELAAFERERARLAAEEKQRQNARRNKTRVQSAAQETRPWQQTAQEPRPGRTAPGQNQPAWQPASKPRRGRWRLLIIGLLTMIVLPIAISVGGVLYAVGGGFGDFVPLGSSGTVYLEQGTEVSIYSSSAGASTTDCTVVDEGGEAVEVAAVDEAFPYGAFTASETGSYTITCPDGTEGMLTGPTLDMEKISVTGFLVIGAFFAGLLGLVLTIVGLVRGISRK